MLYKKYHRSYVRKFKKGAKFMEYIGGYSKKVMCEVDVEPFTRLTPLDCTIRMNIKIIKNGISIGSPRVWIVIFSSGRLSMVGLKFIEDAIQEIS